MTIIVSLLITFAATLLFGGWILAVAIRHAAEGYEDALGFSLGKLPTAPVSLFVAQPGPVDIVTPALAPAFASVDSSTDTTTQAVTIFVSGTGRAASALYRRYRRSTNSSASLFPVSSTSSSSTGSASPFAIQCAATRARANQVDSASPFPVSAKTSLSDGAGL
jgi:hypothetical protein